jgi:LysR family transcriptional regulator, hca operon transcriptional activator
VGTRRPQLGERDRWQLLAGHMVSAGARKKDFVSWGACLGDMEAVMELRHLRYFIAVAEEGSLTLAAEKRLHTAQPSLSRQIRDLEYEVGVQLMSRSVHGIELTAAGRVFLDHARLALTQAEAAAEAARRAAQPSKPTFAMGFQTGQEVDWLPRATSVLRDELLNIEIRVSSDHSTMLADDLQRGKLDIAFLRRQQQADLEYKFVKEPLVVILPSDHPLAERDAIDPHDLVGETFIGISRVPCVLRVVIDDYLQRSGIEIVPHLDGIDNFAMAISLVASTRSVALLPASTQNFLKWSVISRPLKGEAPTIDLAVGYHKANTSPILRTFLSRVDDLTARISSKARRMSGPGSAAAPR